MRKGLSLIEVLVALAVTMAIFMVAMRCPSFRPAPAVIPNLSPIVRSRPCEAHVPEEPPSRFAGPGFAVAQGPGQSILCGNVPFYRFWQVSDVPIGKEIILFVAWDDHLREKAQGFGSLASLQESGCAKISFKDVFLKE